MSESWNQVVTRVYKENKQMDGGYKFKDAMRDASPIYNKLKKSVNAPELPFNKPAAARKNKSKRNHKSKRNRKSRKQ